MAKVYIGIGHGGKDDGAVANGFKEDELNLAIGKACYDVLKRHGVEAMISRTSDVDEKLNAKIAECNKYNPDLCLDIHNNAGGGDGCEVFYHHGGGKSKVMAQNILNEMFALGQNVHSTTPQKVETGLKTRLTNNGEDYYGFIRDTKASAALVECAFVDNKKDIQIIDTAAEQKAMGEAIAKGVLKTLGIAYKKEETKVATVKTDYSKHWAKKAIEYVIGKGYMVGSGKGKFRPNDKITRGEMAQILYNLDHKDK